MNHPVSGSTCRTGARPDDADGLSRLRLFDDAALLVPMGAWSCDLATQNLKWTRGVHDIFGIPRTQVPERQQIVEMYCEASRDVLERTRASAISRCAGFSLDSMITRADGQQRWVRITAAVRRSNGRAAELFGMKQDITADRVRWAQLQAQAECDPLTGLANRARFQQFLTLPEGAVELAGIGALALFDLDRFKHVNDTWGHAAGDSWLATFATRLKTLFPQAPLIARIGGDEFAVLLPPMVSRGHALAQVRSRLDHLLRPVQWQGQSLPLAASSGVAFVPDAARFRPEDLFLAADRALYAAKRAEVPRVVCAV